MEIVLLIIGIIIGTVVGYLAADRKSAALRAEISGTKKEIELLKLQKEEAEALHKRMNTEFENLSNRIFQSKAEDFTRLNTEHLGNLLRPLGDNLKDFRQKVEQVYSTEAKERFSLGERIKEVCLLLLAFGRGVGSIGSQRHFGVDNHFPFVGVFHDDVGLHLLPAFLVDDGFAPFVF